MNAGTHSSSRRERGVGLMEVMISIVISMLLVLVIYQVYEISESQKRTITAGSDAMQGATYGLYALGRDLSMAGNGVASAAASLDTCAILRPIPVLIDAGATAADPDTITVLYGGSSSLSTPVQFKQTATGAQAYLVPGPVGFSDGDVIAAVDGANCTVSTVNAGGVAVNGGTGWATVAHTPIVGAMGATYGAGTATLVNLGKAACPGPPSQQQTFGRVLYSVDTGTHALRTQNLLTIVCASPGTPTAGPVNPLINDVINLKAQYGLDTNSDGIVDAWQDATGGVWSAANLATQPLATLQQVRAVRVGIVTRSAQYEKDPVTTAPLTMFDGTVSMNILGDDQHYRYKVLETIVPLRNALWNTP